MARLPFARRRDQQQIEQDARREAMKASVTALVKAVGGGATPGGSGPTMPGSQFQGGWNNLGNASMAMLQRVTANMGQQLNIPVAEIEQELIEQGLSWGPPFPPGRPLDPFFGFRRPPRTWDFQVGENVQITPRHNRISFKTIKALYDAYDVAQIAARHIINDVRTLDYSWEPMPGIRDDLSDDIAAANAFFDYPDRRLPFRAWLGEYLQDVVRYDAGTLYTRRSQDGTPIALEVIDGTTMIPMVDFYGRNAVDEDDENPPADGATWDGGDTPGFLQIIEGMPWVWLTADDITYIPWNPTPESQYGLAPLEAVLLTANTDVRFQMHFLSYFCYDDQTEILTRHGWRSFSEIDGTEEFATRSPDGQFEWQATKDGTVHRFDYDGELVQFSNRCVDQVVTPNHRMLVRRIPDKPGITKHNEWHDWHIREAQFFVDNPTAEFHMPVTSSTEGGVQPARVPCGMSASAWAAFLGLYVAEGWCRQRGPKGKHRWEITVSQLSGGKLDRVQEIMDGTGLNWTYAAERGKYTVGCKELWQALAEIPVGAPNKHLPAEVMDWTPELLGCVLDGLMTGDGHITKSGQRCYTTTSPTLADQVQVLWQRVGVHAQVRTSQQHETAWGKRTIHVVRTRTEDAFRVPKAKLVPYKGTVSCVSVGNGIVYVRRNGKPAWSGNTEGTIPAGFMEAPPDMSDPTQIAEWQETWDALMLGDQAKLRQVRWVPAGAKYTAVKGGDFQEEFPLYLMRRTVAAFGVTPSDLGFTENTNRAVGETQVDVQFRVGTMPLVRHVEGVINLFAAKELGLRVRFKFDKGQETEDRVATAQAHQIYINSGVESVDEVRAELGRPIDRERPMPRFVANSRSGPIPLLAIQSLAGKIDEETYAPDANQQLVPNPYMPAPGTLPQIGTPELKAVDTASAEMAGHMLEQTTGSAPTPEMAAAIAAQVPPPAGQAPGQGPQAAPAQTPPAQGAGATPAPAPATKEATAGLTAATGVQGVDLLGSDDDDEDEDDELAKAAEIALELRRWRDNTRQRLRKGRAPRRFHSELLDDETIAGVWAELQHAKSRQEVDAVFAGAAHGPFRPRPRSRIRRP